MHGRPTDPIPSSRGAGFRKLISLAPFHRARARALLLPGILVATASLLTACGKEEPEAFKPNTGQIQVLNGSGKSGMADVFRDFLADYGFDIIEFGNAREWNYERTVVISRSAASDRIARDLAKVLGTDRVIHLQHPASLVEATVIIGKDYKELMRSWPQPEKK
jgi:hypothetical protein